MLKLSKIKLMILLSELEFLFEDYDDVIVSKCAGVVVEIIKNI